MKLKILVHSEGPALDPVRWPADVMERRKASSVNRVWRSLYQQDPTDIDGNIFKEVWWQVYDTVPEIVRTGIFIDSAYKAGVSSDYSALAVWAKSAKGNIYLLDVKRARVEFPDLLSMTSRMYDKWKHRLPVVVVEDRSSGQALVPMLRKQGMPCIAWKHHFKGLRATAGKIARMEAVTPFIEQGRAWIPEKAIWREEWLQEHGAVPTGTHDDQVDTTVMAVDFLLGQNPVAVEPDRIFRDRDVPKPIMGGGRSKTKMNEEETELERWRELGLI